MQAPPSQLVWLPPTQHFHGQHSVPDDLERRGAEKEAANALANPNPILDLDLSGSGDNGNGVEAALQQTRVRNPLPATISPPLVTAQAPVLYWTQPLAQGTVDEEEGGYAVNWDRRGQIALTVPRHFLPTTVTVDLELSEYAQYKRLVEHFRPVAELDWTAPPSLPLTMGQSFLPHPISLLQPVVPHSTPAESVPRKNNDVVLDLTADEVDGPVGGEPAGDVQGVANDPTLPPSILAYLATVQKARKPTHFTCKRQLNCSPDFALATNHNQLTRIRFTAVAFEAHNTLFHPHVGADLRSQQCGWVTSGSGKECLHRAQAGDLMKHVEKVHLSGYPCILCEEMYPSKEALTVHMRACVPPVVTILYNSLQPPLKPDTQVYLGYRVVRHQQPDVYPTPFRSQPARYTNWTEPPYTTGIPEKYYNMNHHANAVIIMLARNSDLDGAESSIRQLEARFNAQFGYSYVFLNDVPFTEEFKRRMRAVVSTSTEFGLVPPEHWNQPSWINEDKASKARDKMGAKHVPFGSCERLIQEYVPFLLGGKRAAILFHELKDWVQFFFRHPLLLQYQYYWRPDVQFSCDIQFDPFLFMQGEDKKYGFTISLPDDRTTIRTLRKNVREFVNKNPDLVSPDNGVDMLLDTHKSGKKEYNRCHFWSNFEIGDFDLWRSEPYMKFFEFLDSRGGFYYERWGDAPVHTFGALLFARKDQVHFFNEIGYQHGEIQHCPVGSAFERGRCTCSQATSVDRTSLSCLNRYDALFASRP
uniref:Glycosyltransferase family 15 protein n=1 Tax=Mycena chlorophos TaxID=658473 RepID=A0ABQ0MBG6_MYCCL|nr:glycosyltransferase family 15 protein [Mycena chlorophos]